MNGTALVFDVDNTLTPPRQPLAPAMADALQRLRLPFHLAAGSDLELVVQQVVQPLHERGFRGAFDAFVCNGSDRYRCCLGPDLDIQPRFRFRLRSHLGDEVFHQLVRRVEEILREPEFDLEASGVQVVGERIIDRQSMINVAPMGRPRIMSPEAYAQRAAFVEFDQRTRYRARLLERLRGAVAPWAESHGLRVTLGGQTSFDIVVQGFDKGFPLRTLLDEGVKKILYFGDALHADGNDRAVLDFIDHWQPRGTCPVEALPVRNWEDTLSQLRARGLMAGPARRQCAES